ncbi:MAG TPA: DUF3106 domain-containing protein [Candidatus Saccharimonadales bacterium]|nr:DUF3106 domain-containing protein [Candidatus Saccharimonadales bacterium]
MRGHILHWLGTVLLTGGLQAQQSQLPPAPPALRYQMITQGIQLRHLSPVEYFRGLLGMSAEERERALAHKSPEERSVILAKVKEYEALPADIREARLRQTELRWELSDLMKLPAAARTARLKEISVLDLPMVQSRLRQWDEVPAPVQKELLEKQGFISIYLRLQGASREGQEEILAALPAQRRLHWSEELDRWQALPEKQRAELCGQFQRFCSMSGPEQRETVETLSESERQEMEKALQAFRQLPPAQRAQCIASFGKFATMAPEARNQFFENAARWDGMTARERQLWRELVQKLPLMTSMPPMPPGFPLSLPPFPPGMRPALAAASTNGWR